VRIADSRGGELVEGQVLPPPSEPVTSPPVVTPPPPPPVTPPPEAALAVWGRWQSIADKDPGVVSAKDVLNGRSLVAINRYYVLGTDAASPNMALPGAGVANFTLTAHDGVIVDKNTGLGVASTASDARLSIDFGARRFDTSMNVSAGNLSTPISAKGTIESNGHFQSDAFLYPSSISGIVGGTDAGQAAYLYQRSFNGHYEAAGATSWHK
jgi:hypothetical protein